MSLPKKQSSRFYLIVFSSFLITAGAGFAIRPEKALTPSVVLIKSRICIEIPKFSDYPTKATENFARRPTLLDLTGYPEASAYRAFINTAVARGVNFAGKYIVAEWGCGSDCQNHAIVDAKTGRLIAFGLRSAYGVEFYKNSKLIVFNPNQGIASSSLGEEMIRTKYFIVKNGKLVNVNVCD